ncbi:hypothetical protein CFOL_v3_24890 [Cephalotus follicularis]|uniref:Uncharacterized protein n=1 Tax=Cephalotus follicularis TaxID=3775 RepID=A0A1Q3CMM8_CEPFO|nr:hypothetical protein CFOL_v3_24890 [Cephalotus follicularis]
MVHQLNLKVDKYTSRIKAVNYQVQAVAGMVHDVQISMGDWEGKTISMVVPLDDFEVILGSDFFISENIILMPYLCGLLVTNERRPCFVAGYKATTEGTRTETVVAMQAEMVATNSSSGYEFVNNLQNAVEASLEKESSLWQWEK